VRVQYTKLGRAIANRFGRPRARRIVAWLRDVVPPRASILDVGSGLGHIAEALRAEGHVVTTMDPQYLPLCDGEHLVASATNAPVGDRSYDVVLIAFVLHHMPATLHGQALLEARRIARTRVVLLEDTFSSPRERCWTQVVDSVLNAEYRRHPHSNRTAAEWVEQLESLGMTARLHWERREHWLQLPIRHALLTGEI